ncbi:hypothetical protein [Robertmurraya kyonggiensis]|uniref:Uncharacterized protein n=1 Tax=Robertmurraya kyonggiensis TaxID=1037680 RepID=A0A4U1D3R2_9BACI|nr:hypothetical protein [Robertmurraya kyonggiensis]TKC16834.1 hypothetical protein FA727_12255 [Robertmurraya kyonggiensis]
MNFKELELRLISERIRRDVYSLEGGLPNEAYCISQTNGIWEVYYSERGSKSGLKVFRKEEEACQHFYDSLIKTLRDMGLY